jgi:hypothetical protein
MDLPPKDCLILPPEKLIENLLNTEAFYDTVSTIVFSWLGPRSSWASSWSEPQKRDRSVDDFVAAKASDFNKSQQLSISGSQQIQYQSVASNKIQ